MANDLIRIGLAGISSSWPKLDKQLVGGGERDEGGGGRVPDWLGLTGDPWAMEYLKQWR